MKTTALTQKIQKGFTLVELLVVIAILGILAAALLATLDPIEQISKGRDSSGKSIAQELASALNRYYASHNYYPWTAPTSPCTAPGATGTASTNIGAAAFSSGATSCVGILQSEGELKTTFNVGTFPNYITGNATNQMNMSISADDTNNTVTVCFAPISKSQRKDPSTVYDANGGTGTTYQCITQ